ncbi:MAG: histidine kinase dimerization/phosphoacceptor domain -containing protein [Candidatus Aminicenantaceae bacterium]
MKKLKILFVEDNQFDKMAFERFLKSEKIDYDYTMAESIDETKKILQKNSFDAAVVDYHLKDGTSFELFDHLKNIPFIIVTGTGNEEIAIKAVKSGAYDYLRKDPHGYYLKVLPITVEKAIKQKKTEEKLLLSQFTLDSVINAIFWIGRDGHIHYANKSTCNLLGYSEKELSSMTVHDIDPNYPKEEWESRWKNLKKKRSLIKESSLIKKDGTTFPVEISANYLEFFGKEFNCTFVRDISDQKLDEKKIQNSLREKETLLKEIHHRVKNNIQIISSLLRLQAKNIQNTKIADILKASQSRIKSMALVHEKLYQDEELSKINISNYIKSLVNSLFNMYKIDKKRIKVKLDLEELYINIDTAIPVGLIINEIVSNSLKHAFPENKKGNISIELFKGKKDKYILQISDTGIGLPQGFDVYKTDTLGTSLIVDLTQQLEGTLNISHNNGVIYSLEFELHE